MHAARRGDSLGVMAKRRWMDWDIAVKMLAGLAMMAVPAGLWLATGMVSMRTWVVGGLGVAVFLWGLLSIGDCKNEWE